MCGLKSEFRVGGAELSRLHNERDKACRKGEQENRIAEPATDGTDNCVHERKTGIAQAEVPPAVILRSPALANLHTDQVRPRFASQELLHT